MNKIITVKEYDHDVSIEYNDYLGKLQVKVIDSLGNNQYPSFYNEVASYDKPYLIKDKQSEEVYKAYNHIK